MMGDRTIDDLRDEANVWLQDTLNELGCEAEEVNQATVLKMNKNPIASMLVEAIKYVSRLNDSIRDVKNSNSELKSQVIEAQQAVITTQSALSDCKTQQLNLLKDSVKSSVEDSVKAEFKSYSSAVQSSPPKEQMVSPETLKHVVKHVIQEEDRSRNIMLFGLREETDEKLDAKVYEVLETLGHKPKIDACRLGFKNDKKAIRPVKVTVSSATIVNQILSKARNLKEVQQLKTVFICPDRSLEQRKVHRLLVTDLKRKKEEEPGKRFFIKGGKIQGSG